MSQRNKILKELLACLLILLFTHTALSKLFEPAPFWYALGEIPVIKNAAHVFVWAVPCVELVIAGSLIFPLSRKTGFQLSFILLLLFSFYIIAMMIFLPQLPCSCGGIVQRLNWGQHLVLNLVLALGSYWGWFGSKRVNNSIKNTFQPT